MRRTERLWLLTPSLGSVVASARAATQEVRLMSAAWRQQTDRANSAGCCPRSFARWIPGPYTRRPSASWRRRCRLPQRPRRHASYLQEATWLSTCSAGIALATRRPTYASAGATGRSPRCPCNSVIGGADPWSVARIRPSVHLRRKSNCFDLTHWYWRQLWTT